MKEVMRTFRLLVDETTCNFIAEKWERQVFEAIIMKEYATEEDEDDTIRGAVLYKHWSNTIEIIMTTDFGTGAEDIIINHLFSIGRKSGHSIMIANLHEGLS